MEQSTLFLFAILSGICFGSMSYAYQMGRRWHVPATQIAFVALVIGSIFFMGYMYFKHLAQGLTPGNPWLAPRQVWCFTIIGGIGQAVTILMIDPAQKRGPAAPGVCAMNLIFLPAAIYALLVLNENITALQYLGLLSAVGCVVVAGNAGSKPCSGAHVPRAPMDRLLYPLLLLGLMVSSSLSTIVIKQLHATPFESASLFTFHKGLFLFLTYACGALGTALMLTRKGWSNFLARKAFLLGGVTAVGSICGFLAYCHVSDLPGGTGFALSNVVCFVTIAIIATLVFKEKRNIAWYLTILMAVASVILFAMGLG